MPHIDRIVVLWVPFDGPWAVLPVQAGEFEWATFRAALQVLRWHDAQGVQDVLGPPLYGLTSEVETPPTPKPEHLERLHALGIDYPARVIPPGTGDTDG
jgi:hypothetical protein